MPSLLRGDDDGGAIVKGNGAQLEGNVMAFQDVPDRNAERATRGIGSA
jgi:hypothetical protein